MNNNNNTIYQCLTSTFWTKRKCWNCQHRFTNQDYHNQNYFFTFQEILSVWEDKEFPLPRDNACLDGVLVKLFHKQCPYSCAFSYQKDITCWTENKPTQ